MIERARVLLEDGAVVFADVVQYEGTPWIVCGWAESPDGRWRKPAHIASLLGIQHQRTPHVDYQWTVNDPLPNALFENAIPTAVRDRYGVRDWPEITFATDSPNQGALDRKF